MRLLFDRGTILVSEAPPGVDLGDVPGLLWDPRVKAHRAPARRYLEVREHLARRGVSFRDGVPFQDPEPAKSVWSAIPLRPYQEAALCAWDLGERRGLVVLPTGSGKTRIALAAMARTGLRSLCLVPTRVLLEQWLREIRAVYGGKPGCFGDGLHECLPVTVATFEGAFRHMDKLGNRFDLLVIDEAHHFGSGLRDEALEMSIAPARLGLTASPPRQGAAAARLAELIGPPVYELAVGDLAGRFLASFDIVTLHLELTDEERATYEALMAAFRGPFLQFRRFEPEGSWQDFVRNAARTAEGWRAISAWRQARKLLAFTGAKRKALESLLDRHRQSRALVFTADNDSAYAIARERLIMPLTCDIGRKEREEVLARFSKGELRALVSARVLNEGLDVPDAEVAVVVGGAFGEREHLQRVGRLLRPAPGKRALVYELVSRGTMEIAQARRRREGLAPRITAQI
jgi:superfamily II DNA or RNA helicase